MNRADAERVFALVNEMSGDLAGRIVSERWWLVWVAVGVDVLLVYSGLQLLIWSGETRPLVLLAPRAVNLFVLFLIIKFIHRGAGGQRTATEDSLWWIWATYLLGTMAVGLLEMLAGLPAYTMAPMFALLASFAFSSMALVSGRLFVWLAVLFLAVAAAMSLMRDYQLFIYAGSWFAVLVALGLYYRLTLAPTQTRRL
jgi:hypothetical protein